MAQPLSFHQFASNQPQHPAFFEHTTDWLRIIRELRSTTSALPSTPSGHLPPAAALAARTLQLIYCVTLSSMSCSNSKGFITLFHHLEGLVAFLQPDKEYVMYSIVAFHSAENGRFEPMK